MKLFDLHCDTLTEYMGCPSGSLDAPESAYSLSGIPAGLRSAQCTAVFIPDGLAPEARTARYLTCLRELKAQEGERLAQCTTAAEIEAAWAKNQTAAVLTVENGSLLRGELDRLPGLYADGVRMMTLTWNGINEIGSGKVSRLGLTDFGKALVPEMERLGMLCDVSHLNDPGFEDFIRIAEKPFVASHSNARALCPHPRDLTDGQLREMIARRCLVGLNFFSPFLRDDGEYARPEDLLRHADHILELGGQDLLALGSDFDGAALPPWLRSVADEAALADLFLNHGFGQELTEKLMYRNALDFFRRNVR